MLRTEAAADLPHDCCSLAGDILFVLYILSHSLGYGVIASDSIDLASRGVSA